MTELDEELQGTSESEKRIKQLSGKVKEEAEAKEAALKAQANAEAKALELERKAEFSDGFTDIVAKNPLAKDFKADIQAKVMSGYTLEDATYAVLGKAGKLSQEPERESPAGGSAVTAPSQGGQKTVGQMTQDERRSALMEAESKGEISIS